MPEHVNHAGANFRSIGSNMEEKLKNGQLDEM